MRHPDDPEPAADSKAVAALCLGALGALTGVALGGVVPATVALVLARQASAEVADGEGWRTGAPYVLWARRLAWIGIALAIIALVSLVIMRLLDGIDGLEQDFPPGVD